MSGGDLPGEALIALRLGEAVCLPTESSYGLAVDASMAAALEWLARLKGGRPADSPFPLVVADAEAARELAAVWPDAAERLAVRHWPGPLTLVVPARAGLAPELIGPGGGVGVRVSSHPVARALAASLGGAITATSANRSGQPAASTVEQARAVFGDDIACYLDGGVCAGTPSTVVAVDERGSLRLLRPGPIVVDLEG